VLINGRPFDGVPAELAPVLAQYAERQGRTAVLGPDGSLRVEGPLAGQRFLIESDDPALEPLAAETAALLEMLGADAGSPSAIVGLGSGDGPVVGPAGLFRGEDRVLAGCLREGLQAHSGRQVREAPLLARGWKPPAAAPAAVVLVPPGEVYSAVLGLTAGLLRFAGRTPEQIEALGLPDLLSEPLGDAGPDALLPTSDGQWISPRARALQESEVVTPPAHQT
ncbi:MAG TPA: hypothetical protein VNT75_27445, partial [Symbiobacteriaceae bacterium]|nr:hypothetical protein [Symbiobacteriaceae bacterium]